MNCPRSKCLCRKVHKAGHPIALSARTRASHIRHTLLTTAAATVLHAGTLHQLSLPDGTSGPTSSPLSSFYLRTRGAGTYALELPPGSDTPHLLSMLGRHVSVEHVATPGALPKEAGRKLVLRQLPALQEQGPQGATAAGVESVAAAAADLPHQRTLAADLPHRRTLAAVPGPGTAPIGSVAIVYIIMDMSSCGIPPATTPQVRNRTLQIHTAGPRCSNHTTGERWDTLYTHAHTYTHTMYARHAHRNRYAQCTHNRNVYTQLGMSITGKT